LIVVVIAIAKSIAVAVAAAVTAATRCHLRCFCRCRRLVAITVAVAVKPLGDLLQKKIVARSWSSPICRKMPQNAAKCRKMPQISRIGNKSLLNQIFGGAKILPPFQVG